jgi:SprT-like family
MIDLVRTIKPREDQMPNRRATKDRHRRSDGQSAAITPIEYGGLQEAYDFLNQELFGGRLPDVFITYQRKSHSAGYFAADRFSGRVASLGRHELALNPDHFIDRTDKQIVSTLAHEMHHVAQHTYGKPSARGYHNQEWAAMMQAIGLMPSNTGAVGGRQTGYQMDHYIIPDAPFDKAFAKLAAIGWKLNLQSAPRPGATKGPNSKIKFTCPVCESNVWGKPDTATSCSKCTIAALQERDLEAAVPLLVQMRSANGAASDVLCDQPEQQPVSYELELPPVSYEIPEPPPTEKRGRGRPKGSKNKPKEVASYDQPKRKRGRPKGSKNKPKDSAAPTLPPY